jgi:hypothetical protein
LYVADEVVTGLDLNAIVFAYFCPTFTLMMTDEENAFRSGVILD